MYLYPGIDYLHRKKGSKLGIVHQNISAENILVDARYSALLADSGVHKLLADDVVFSTLKASAAMGYLPPEYATTGRLTEKSDVYSFGIFIMEIISGRSPVDYGRPARETRLDLLNFLRSS